MRSPPTRLAPVRKAAHGSRRYAQGTRRLLDLVSSERAGFRRRSCRPMRAAPQERRRTVGLDRRAAQVIVLQARIAGCSSLH